MRNYVIALFMASMFVGAATVWAGEPNSMRIAGNFSFNAKHVDTIERPFFQGLPEATGLTMRINYNPMDVVNVQAADALRLLRTGTFDVMSVQIGMASRDDPFFEGIDLIGGSTNMEELREAVEAYREDFDKRLQRRFNAKVLTLWPFGPQVFYSNAPLKEVEDLKGLKVRSFTPSMAAFIQYFGGTPVTLSFSEVYPSLQRGVIDAAITSPSSGNSGKWPEVSKYFYPLSLSGSVQGHFVNLDYWNKFSPETQEKLLAEGKKLEDLMWELAVDDSDDAGRCNTGQEPCTTGSAFAMEMVAVTPESEARVKDAVNKTVLPMWKETCMKVDPEIITIWNATVGKVRGYTIE
ncbi:MAG: TRAP transporter substrate-binding protein [Planctomycetes bacterium]|nr:TRAP transporter substrate-binding protein [Planctomycetota bacterium]